jgi:hypothetical protein
MEKPAMSTHSGDGALYCVVAFGQRRNFTQEFKGDRAFSEANEFYERMKARTDINKVTFSRWDGNDWAWLEAPFDD